MTVITYGPAMYETAHQSLEQLVTEHATLVKRIAHHLKARLPESVQVEDLIQSGMLGLFEAARNYDRSKGATFETYAGIRIRGSMLDEVRKGDWVPRSVHRNSRRISEAIHNVEARVGRDASDQEIAEELGVELNEYYSLLQDTQGSKLFSYEDLLDQNQPAETGYEHSPQPLQSSGTPDSQVEQHLMRSHLIEAIKSLPEREQLVLSLYYDEELNLKEIGEVLGVSESRVSQIHSQAANRLKARLRGWIG
ncbi:DNA-directed RNA polymerase specialized sigma subunit [Gynuella sunshinyii YC6258]|uniref:RNA polymerase sigma factor FliA n=2 Tax=Gynuella sunshinyii TaxID=1445505 RepID=A0A0C5VNT0_9GAMM|nr:DNA-directed RNA polymerase specialized sigma subunit [Gynuella sunshinyii YC6258]